MNETNRQNRWVLADPIPPEIAANLGDYSFYFKQILFNRGIVSLNDARRYTAGGLTPADPFMMLDMQCAANRISDAITRGEKIAVYGDYDVDGISATALLVQVIEALGGVAEAYLPNRFEEGYGVNDDALQTLAGKGFKLVVTVDCGIRSPHEVETARSLGMDMVITDHHHPASQLPQAAAVVCPKREGDPYPDKNLSGVGVAYRLAQALAETCHANVDAIEQWLDLVALGTVADVVPLTGENRELVRAGLERIRKSQRVGLVELAKISGRNIEKLTSIDISFALGPRLNAAGRMESPWEAYKLLVAQDESEAKRLAQCLNDKNRERQESTLRMQETVEGYIEGIAEQSLILAIPPEFGERDTGLVGLVASRLVDNYYRPAVVGCRVGQFIRASCRSIPEFHITRALDDCADLLVRHGGHALAAGFTLAQENLPRFEERLMQIAGDQLRDVALAKTHTADVVLPLENMDNVEVSKLLKELDLIHPCGEHNREATFLSRNVQVAKKNVVGMESQHLRLELEFRRPEGGMLRYKAIGFGLGGWLPALPPRVDLLYKLEIDTYTGTPQLQLRVEDIRPSMPVSG